MPRPDSYSIAAPMPYCHPSHPCLTGHTTHKHMNKTSIIAVLLTTALAALLTACGGPSDAHLSLEEAEDSLRTNPVRSLAMLDSMAARSIPDPADQALHALLTTQARSMVGYEETDDSLISTAVAYYRKHDHNERLMKALYLQGCIDKNARDFSKAVLAASETTDLANKRTDWLWMAKGEELLTHIFRLTQKSDDCLKHSVRAAEYYKKAGRTINHWFCLTDIVDAYTMGSNYGRAAVLLDSIESVVSDSGVLSDCMAQHMYIYLDQGNYTKAEQCMRRLMDYRNNYESGPVEHTWLARIRHAKGDHQGARLEIDSARAEVRDAVDKMYITQSVYRMLKDDHDYQRAIDYADSLIAYQGEAARESFRQTVVSAQRDYYNTQAKKEVTERNRMQRLAISVIVVCLVLFVFTVGTHRIRMHVKDNQIESKMNEILVLSERVRQDDKENQDLKMLAERSLRDRWDTVNLLCNEYFEKGDNQKLKSTIINKVDEEMERICSKKHMEEIETMVNQSLNGIVDKLRTQCPDLKSEDVLFATLIYAGLAPRAVCLCTGIKLKYFYTKRMRLVERINNSSATDKELFISKLWRHSDKDSTPHATTAEGPKE